jgi:succinoglycan biosynthesis protein ExoM
MNNIVVCIPTYKRPLMLKKLILSIIENNLDQSLLVGLNIIAVDNDIERTAEAVLNELREQHKNTYNLIYYNYPIKGLSNVRNYILDCALQFKPDYIVCIDDDEYVTSEWLNELIKSITNNKADVVRGPVLAIADEPIPAKIWYWFRRENFKNNSQINTLASGNMIMKSSSLQQFNIKFDHRFNFLGAEDSFFGIQILKKGAKICWAANAIAYETIPKRRASLNWLIKRTYRGASTYAYILVLEKEYLSLLKKIVISFIYVILGFISLFYFLIPVKTRYWGILKLSEGIGGLLGGLLLYKEYK